MNENLLSTYLPRKCVVAILIWHWPWSIYTLHVVVGSDGLWKLSSVWQSAFLLHDAACRHTHLMSCEIPFWSGGWCDVWPWNDRGIIAQSHARPCDIGRQETICALKKVMEMNPVLIVVGWIVNVIEWKANPPLLRSILVLVLQNRALNNRVTLYYLYFPGKTMRIEASCTT